MPFLVTTIVSIDTPLDTMLSILAPFDNLLDSFLVRFFKFNVDSSSKHRDMSYGESKHGEKINSGEVRNLS